MKEQYLEKCPLCGAELEGEFRESLLLREMSRLKEQGVLEHSIYVAVGIVRTMNDNNPAWLRELLNEQAQDLKQAIKETEEGSSKIRDALLHRILEQVSEMLGSPQSLGKLREIEIAKRLSALKLGADLYVCEKSTRAGEDVMCIVRENGLDFGKIMIESKKTKKWSDAYIEQCKQYMDKEDTKFGMVVAEAMPDDALNHTTVRNGVLVVKIEHLESAYIFMRGYLKLAYDLEKIYQARLKELDVEDQIIKELRDAVSNGELDSIIRRIQESTLEIERFAGQIEKYFEGRLRGIRHETQRISKEVQSLVVDHIERIRQQLIRTSDTGSEALTAQINTPPTRAIGT